MYHVMSNFFPSLLWMRDVLCDVGTNLSQAANAHWLAIWERCSQNQFATHLLHELI
jgi:hypothetical protein